MHTQPHSGTQQQLEQQQQQSAPYVSFEGTGLDPDSEEGFNYMADQLPIQLHLRGIACDG